MNKLKNLLIILLILSAGTGIFYIGSTYAGSNNWIRRFDKELNHFFGEDNWKHLSTEKENSDFLRKSTNYHEPDVPSDRPVKFKNWYISFVNQQDKEEVCKITNHTLKINHDKYHMFSDKRYSNKQAFVLQLMNIAMDISADEVVKDFEAVLSPEEAACLNVYLSYYGGNPRPKFYDALWKEEWFTVDDVSAEKFLAYDLHKFYIFVGVHKYRLEKLSEEQQKNILQSKDALAEHLLSKYDNIASFEILMDETKTVYENGNKIK